MPKGGSGGGGLLVRGLCLVATEGGHSIYIIQFMTHPAALGSPIAGARVSCRSGLVGGGGGGGGYSRAKAC